MRICRYWEPEAGARVGWIDGGRVLDLGSVDPGLATIAGLLACEDRVRRIEAARLRLEAEGIPFAQLDIPPDAARAHLLAPVDRQEVWAAGVTYLRSRDARMDESAGGGSFYDKVYGADRPELFFKATPRRVVGPNGPIRVRADSRWSVPEPELALVIDPRGAIAGFTIGNDVSARDIEGENPLYLPQAKVYRGSCALGPAIVLAESVPDPSRLELKLSILRGGTPCFAGSTTIARMKRGLEELASWLCREQDFPPGVVLLTGTGIVPPDDFTLRRGDLVEISAAGIGTLRNPVGE